MKRSSTNGGRGTEGREGAVSQLYRRGKRLEGKGGDCTRYNPAILITCTNMRLVKLSLSKRHANGSGRGEKFGVRPNSSLDSAALTSGPRKTIRFQKKGGHVTTKMARTGVHGTSVVFSAAYLLERSSHQKKEDERCSIRYV